MSVATAEAARICTACKLPKPGDDFRDKYNPHHFNRMCSSCRAKFRKFQAGYRNGWTLEKIVAQRLGNHRHRARELGVDHECTADPNVLAAKWRATGGACKYCGNTFELVKLVMDHIHPLSKGGRNETDNFEFICEGCNCRKHAKLGWQP
jgi:hypothetical protein